MSVRRERRLKCALFRLPGKGCILFQTEQFVATKLFFQALDSFDGILVSGVETLGGRCVSDFEVLIIVSIQRVESVCVVANYVEKIRRLVRL